jgi:hypothetical protein
MDSDFGYGLFTGLIVTSFLAITGFIIHGANENSGYKDKMVIEYHCPDKEYERHLILDMVNGSGIQTNFVNKEVTMGKYYIKYRLTNPKN